MTTKNRKTVHYDVDFQTNKLETKSKSLSNLHLRKGRKEKLHSANMSSNSKAHSMDNLDQDTFINSSHSQRSQKHSVNIINLLLH